MIHRLASCHGPKSIIDDRTLTVVYLSDNEYQRQYEIDLIKEMGPQRKKNRIVAVMNTPCEAVKGLVDYTVEMLSVSLWRTYFLASTTLPSHRLWQS